MVDVLLRASVTIDGYAGFTRHFNIVVAFFRRRLPSFFVSYAAWSPPIRHAMPPASVFRASSELIIQTPVGYCCQFSLVTFSPLSLLTHVTLRHIIAFSLFNIFHDTDYCHILALLILLRWLHYCHYAAMLVFSPRCWLFSLLLKTPLIIFVIAEIHITPLRHFITVISHIIFVITPLRWCLRFHFFITVAAIIHIIEYYITLFILDYYAITLTPLHIYATITPNISTLINIAHH